MGKRSLLLILFVFVLIHLKPDVYSSEARPSGGGWTGHFTIYGEYKPGDSYKVIKGKGEINVYLPDSYLKTKKRMPLLIALPGWKAKADEWRTKAKIHRYAEKYNFIIALVEVWTTAYETAYYKETNPRFKWGNIPGTLWVGSVVLPFLRKHFPVDLSGNNTGIFGLSTGGRGAVYLSQKYAGNFKACVSMSGDFDRIDLYKWTKKHRKNIMRHDPPSVTIYGHPAKSKRIYNRWKSVDNPSDSENVNKLKNNNVSVLLIHGKKDRAVPYSQTLNFYYKLKHAGVDAKLVINESAGHNWYLWRSYVPLMFQFFQDKFK